MHQRRILKQMAVIGLGCWLTAGMAFAAEPDAGPETQTAQETASEAQTEAGSEAESEIAEGLPEDGILYFDLEDESEGSLQLTEKGKKTYVVYGDGKDTEETEISLLDVPAAYYATTALYMRAFPDVDSEIVQVLQIEQKITVYAEADKWFLAGTDRGFGFVASAYLTDSAEEAAQAVRTEEAARAEAEARAAREAAAAAQQAAQYHAPASSSGSGVHEVRRENVPSCEDGSHGTTYITYSDGSVKTVDY